jgi:hypothetical protein
MFTRKKGNKELIFKILLVTGYCFLFACQFNYRYFNVANFYVYNSPAHAGPSIINNSRGNDNRQAASVPMTRTVESQRAPGQHGVLFRNNAQRPSHLGVDKRFHFKNAIRVPQIRAPGLPVYTLTRTRFYAPIPVYTTSNLPTNGLRGPPCA